MAHTVPWHGVVEALSQHPDLATRVHRVTVEHLDAVHPGDEPTLTSWRTGSGLHQQLEVGGNVRALARLSSIGDPPARVGVASHSEEQPCVVSAAAHGAELNPEQRRLLNMALVWQPFGAPPEGEILVAFGISGRAFRHRVRRILTAPTAGPAGSSAPALRSARTILRSYLAPEDLAAHEQETPPH
ncbi:hypothetical protein [Nocardia sp. AG03]|uniref:hypothetical protein n=1 Tax=Nocardia sp. AG03 TaxID=3025312 RepID=UPI002418848B|nr:hypothetical protein [Nocardia sp. AG03]